MTAYQSARAIRSPLMAFFAMGTFWGVWGALIPDVKSMVGADDRAFGFALLFVALGAVPAMLVGGRLLDRVGRRLLPASMVLFAVAVVLPGLARTPTELSAALLIMGMGSGLMDVAMNARVGAIEAATGTRSMHLAHGMFAVIYLFAAFATGAARDAGARPLSVLLVASTILAALALLAVVLGKGQGSAAQPADNSGPSLRQGLGLPIILLGLITFAAFLAENGWQSWSALFLERSFGVNPWLGSAAPATVGLALAAGRLGGQVFAQRISDRTMIVAASLVAVSGGIALALSPSPYFALVALFVAAGGVSVIAPSALSMAGRTATPERRGAAVAAVGVIGYTGFFAGPALLGLVADSFGLRFALGMIVGVIVLVIPLITLHWLYSATTSAETKA